ncbi:HesA/MoeB/ThiF family protein [Reinekea blandensis]|uniref:Molybdopterin-synthase adenylyltransferase n=1 Tax=Reinekea blandensis MED297 TaxID=314283 RepID=A4BI10_9GAMM|nr:molybdopterin-synthase adenylyltransferase MoeB [Reinekea blandensis]EAR08282.1 adenylyltransferase [Reinekea sp. MED297] [Reinekea blandensis MED297]
MNELNDDQLLRYARNILLPQVDITGQQQLLASHVVVIGAGGLGAPVLQYLAAAGVGTLTLVDDDVVDETNLQRQVIHRRSNVGQLKVDSAEQAIHDLNPDIRVHKKAVRLSDANVSGLLSGADVMVIGTDNFGSRYTVNQWCAAHSTPLVSGAAIGTSGQLTSFRFSQAEEPCFRCIYEDGQDDALTCATAGVLGPVVGAVGSMMAMETLKLILNQGEPLIGRLMIWDAMTMDWQSFRYQQNPTCPVCQTRIGANL